MVGDVKAADVNTLAEQYFGDWKAARPSPRLRTVEPTPAGPKRVEAQAPAGPTYALNVLQPALGHPDGPALDVLAGLLGGADGMLTKTLVNKESIATNATAQFVGREVFVDFPIRVTPRRNEDLPAVEAGVDRVLRDVAAGRVTPQEIEAAVLAMHFDFIRDFEEIGPTSVTLGSYAVTHRWEYLAELPQLWAAVTPGDLARVVIKYFDPQLRTTGILKRGDKPAPWVPSFTSASNAIADQAGSSVPAEAAEVAQSAGPRLAGVAGDRAGTGLRARVPRRARTARGRVEDGDTGSISANGAVAASGSIRATGSIGQRRRADRRAGDEAGRGDRDGRERGAEAAAWRAAAGWRAAGSRGARLVRAAVDGDAAWRQHVIDARSPRRRRRRARRSVRRRGAR